MGLDTGFAPPPPRRRRAPQGPPLTPEEEKSILGYATGGLGWIASTLDKPGAAVRGLLAGRPEQLLNLIPFSDTLGLTDESGLFGDSINVIRGDDRVSGRELLEMAGAPENKPGLFNSVEDALWDVAGFGTEVVTDPLTWVSGGAAAVTKAGRLAKGAAVAAMKGVDAIADTAKALEATKAIAQQGGKRILGSTAAARADEIRQGLRGLVGFKVPFAKNPLFTVGAGKEWAAKTVEALYYKPWSPVVPFRALFSKVVGGVPPVPVPGGWGMAQKARDLAYDEFVNAMALNKEVANVIGKRMPEFQKLWGSISEHAKAMGDGFPDFDDFARHVGEQTGIYGRAAEDMAANITRMVATAPTQAIEPFRRSTVALVDLLLDQNQRVNSVVEKLGGRAGWLQSLWINHFPRRNAKWGHYSLHARKEFFDVPGGTLTLQRASRDPLLTATAKAGKEDLTAELAGALEALGVPVEKGAKLGQLQTDYLWHKHLKPAYDEAVTAAGKNPERLAELAAEQQRLLGGFKAGEAYRGKILEETQGPLADDLAKYLRDLPEETRQSGLFNRGFLMDEMDYQEYMATTASNLRSIHHLFQKSAGVEPQSEGAVSLTQAFQDMKGAVHGGHKGISMTGAGRDTIAREFLENLQKTDPEAAAKLVADLDPAKEDFLKLVSDRISVDPRVSQVAARYLEVADPRVQGWFADKWNKITSVYKWGLTSPWPAFHARNFADGSWRNWVRIGPDTYSFKSLAKHESQFAKVAAGSGRVEDLEYFDDAKLFGILDSKWFEEVIGKQVEAGAPVHRNPLSAIAYGFGEGLAEEGTKLHKAKRFFGRPAENLYRWVEFHNRYVPFAAAIESGRSPSQAAALVREIQYDYGKLAGGSIGTTFGDHMRQVFPFWGFMRENIPYQIKQLVEHPGGGHAQTLRLISNAHRESGEYQPAWLKERAALRLGGPEDKALMMSSFGLSIEDLSKFGFRGVTPSVGRTIDRVVADMHPLLGMGLSLWSGKEPYTGRSLKELEPFTGLGPEIDTMLYRTPISRGASTLRMLADERKTPLVKAINLSTGVKLSTHDLEKAKLNELDRLNEMMVASDPYARTFSTSWIPPEYRDRITPETVRAMALSKRIEQARKRLRAERERRMAAGVE